MSYLDFKYGLHFVSLDNEGLFELTRLSKIFQEKYGDPYFKQSLMDSFPEKQRSYSPFNEDGIWMALLGQSDGTRCFYIAMKDENQCILEALGRTDVCMVRLFEDQKFDKEFDHVR